MTKLDYRNGVSIAEIVVYVPGLAVAIFLAVRHGFRRNAGWMFLIVFCLARIIGPSMQLATIKDKTNISLYEGAAILSNVGFSPLELAALGMLSRLLDNINKSHHTVINSRMLKGVELLITVGLILGIVGGVNAGSDYQKTLKYQPGSLNKAGTILMVVAYLLTVAITIITSVSVSHAEHGEKRLLMAVGISLPFLLVRLIYSILSTFTTNKAFNLLSGNVTVLLCVALLPEFIVVLVYMGIGLTLSPVTKIEHAEGARVASADSEYAIPQQRKNDNAALRIAKKTIIGRIVMSMVPENRDVEMQHQQQRYVQK